MTDPSSFISRRCRAAAVLGETLWWGRFVAALGAVFLVRLIGLTADKFLSIPVGVEGSAAFAAYCLVFTLTPMHLTWEMRSTCPLLMVVWPPRGELGRMPLIARFAALLGLVVAIAPGALVLFVVPGGPHLLDLATGIFFSAVLAVMAVRSFRSRRAGHRPDIAAGRRRFQKWHAW